MVDGAELRRLRGHVADLAVAHGVGARRHRDRRDHGRTEQPLPVLSRARHRRQSSNRQERVQGPTAIVSTIFWKPLVARWRSLSATCSMTITARSPTLKIRYSVVCGTGTV